MTSYVYVFEINGAMDRLRNVENRLLIHQSAYIQGFIERDFETWHTLIAMRMLPATFAVTQGMYDVSVEPQNIDLLGGKQNFYGQDFIKLIW